MQVPTYLNFNKSIYQIDTQGGGVGSFHIMNAVDFECRIQFLKKDELI